MVIKLKQEQEISLLAQLKRAFNDAEQFQNELSINYQDAWEYFLSKKPITKVDGGSTYVEPVLREAVDRLLPQQLNIFTSSESQAVIYRPMDMMFSPNGQPLPTSMIADAVNKKINEIFLRGNNGYDVLTNAFTESLLTGGAYIKWYIEESREENCIEFEDWMPFTVLEPLVKQYPDTDISVLEKKVENQTVTNPQTGEKQKVKIPFIKGKLNLLKIIRDIKIDHINLNEIFIDSRATDIANARYLCHRQAFTIAELVEMGFDKDLLENAGLAQEDTPLNKRMLLIDGTMESEDDSANYVDPMERRAHLSEHYIYSSLLNKKGKTKLYQVFATDCQILEVREVESIPFAYGKPISISGSLVGLSMYDICKSYQDNLSHSVRMLMDDTQRRVFPRFHAVKNSYDRRSMMDYRPGGIVEVNVAGAIVPETPYNVAPDFNSLITNIGASRDRTVGVQSSNPLEATSLNNVNSQTVGMILSNQEVKDKRIAGNYARTLIRPLFEGLYQTLRSESVMLTLADGSKFNTAQLPKVSNFAIDIFTASDAGVLIAILTQAIQLAATAAQNPTSVVNIRAVIEEMLKSTHLTQDQLAKFLPPPQPPKPEDLAIIEAKKQLEIQTLTAQLESIQAQTQNLLITVAKEEVRTSEMIADGVSKRQRDEEESLRKFKEMELKAAELGVKVDIAANEAVMDRAELELEATQKRGVAIGS